MAKKQNCWEFMKCGREPGGERVKELGVCPVALDSSANGINSGKMQEGYAGLLQEHCVAERYREHLLKNDSAVCAVIFSKRLKRKKRGIFVY